MSMKTEDDKDRPGTDNLFWCTWPNKWFTQAHSTDDKTNPQKIVRIIFHVRLWEKILQKKFMNCLNTSFNTKIFWSQSNYHVLDTSDDLKLLYILKVLLGDLQVYLRL